MLKAAVVAGSVVGASLAVLHSSKAGERQRRAEESADLARSPSWQEARQAWRLQHNWHGAVEEIEDFEVLSKQEATSCASQAGSVGAVGRAAAADVAGNPGWQEHPTERGSGATDAGQEAAADATGQLDWFSLLQVCAPPINSLVTECNIEGGAGYRARRHWKYGRGWRQPQPPHSCLALRPVSAWPPAKAGLFMLVLLGPRPG